MPTPLYTVFTVGSLVRHHWWTPQKLAIHYLFTLLLVLVEHPNKGSKNKPLLVAQYNRDLTWLWIWFDIKTIVWYSGGYMSRNLVSLWVFTQHLLLIQCIACTKDLGFTVTLGGVFQWILYLEYWSIRIFYYWS